MICNNCLTRVAFHPSGFCSQCRYERYTVWVALVFASLFIAVMAIVTLRNFLR